MNSVSVIILAGGPNQPPLQKALGFPVAGLPLEPDRTILTAWLEVIERTACGLQSPIYLLCSTAADAEWFSAELRRGGRNFASVDVRLDIRSHRGVCGLLADTAGACPLADRLLLIELNTLPPRSLSPLLEVGTAPDIAMAVASSRDERPSGAFMLKSSLLEDVPRLGYVDLKEQFLPQLVARGCRIGSAVLAETSVRLIDRRNYLRGIRIWQSDRDPSSGASGVAGSSVVCEGVANLANSFVLDSVVLPGATIGQGAVIARSVVGPLMQVPDGAVLVDAVLANPRLGSGTGEFKTSQGTPISETPSNALPSWSR
jgi:hypothetical protein